MKMTWKCNSEKDIKKLICYCYVSENMVRFLKEGDEHSKGRGKQQVTVQPRRSLLVGIRRALNLDV